MTDHVAIGKKSRRKGARGEHEFAELCQKYGFSVKRTAQYRGNTGAAADVEGIEGWHIEVKRVERLDLHGAMNQSISDAEAAGDGVPVVAHRRNNAPWMITMLAEDWLDLIKGE